MTHADYSLYLVTGREFIPEGLDYYTTIEEAIKGGVTIVQVREKTADTGEFLEIARRTKNICRKYDATVIINDRVDIALAIGADGVHVGQTDMPVSVARSLLPEGSIIGVSCNNVQHAKNAIQDGADYIGVGAVWDTQTKQLTSPIVGVRGVGEILQALDGTSVKAVAIGGIKSTNLLRTLHGAVAVTGHKLDGIAVVSEIMASKSPRVTARKLSGIVRAFNAAEPPLLSAVPESRITVAEITTSAATLLTKLRETGPLIHQITNNVVINQSANATLALGASPIMATAVEEMADLSKVSNALLVNFGTISDLSGMLEAGRCANATRKPVVFDPVAVGATAYRRTSANLLLNTWQASVIKGNQAEIGALANSTEVQSKGVDSVGEGFKDPVPTLKTLALKERCIIVMTGKRDYITDGQIVISILNGNPMLGNITGSGCIVGTSVASFCGAASLVALGSDENDDGVLPHIVRGDMLLSAVAGVLAVTIASEYAARRDDVKGIGTFLPALLDELYNLTPEKIINDARIELVG